MAYITKTKSGLIQLWTNKPEYNEETDCYYAWIDRENNKNEIAIEVTNNDYIRNNVEYTGEIAPCCFELEILLY